MQLELAWSSCGNILYCLNPDSKQIESAKKMREKGGYFWGLQQLAEASLTEQQGSADDRNGNYRRWVQAKMKVSLALQRVMSEPDDSRQEQLVQSAVDSRDSLCEVRLYAEPVSAQHLLSVPCFLPRSLSTTTTLPRRHRRLHRLRVATGAANIEAGVCSGFARPAGDYFVNMNFFCTALSI